ncbi:hypothetical protein OIU74_013798 [Salix koriyanagi]|uniref:Uncharacterized protein n=1 Tax=Salix koriyanagi TaxID=2511006 RepID=A0A9Q0Q9V8_9ROSI|nr:hypothetical protein OIU74_013798 [Salix koriyanagi]
MTNTSANIPSSVSQPTDLVGHKAIDQAQPHSTPLSSVSFSPVSPSSSSTGGGFASAGGFAGAVSISDGFAAVASGVGSGGAASGSGFAAVGTWEPTRYRWYFSFFLDETNQVGFVAVEVVSRSKGV